MSHNSHSEQASIAIFDVSRLAALELAEGLGFQPEVEPPSEASKDYGDLTVVTVVVVVSAAALKALSIWLVKQRSSTVLRHRVEIRNVDGSTQRHVVEVKSSTNGAVSAEVLQQLVELTQVDPASTQQTAPEIDQSLS